LPGNVRRYCALHATLDVQHSNREILSRSWPVTGNFTPLIAEGALLPPRAGARRFERYRRELQVQRVQRQLEATG